MRGKVAGAYYYGTWSRITPAYAGKSCRHEKSRNQSKDHPRVCGEKKMIFPIWRNDEGSPPRMRGKDDFRCGAVVSLRITPAYAGKRRKI